jgi:hypothetical protein
MREKKGKKEKKNTERSAFVSLSFFFISIEDANLYSVVYIHPKEE